MPKPQPIQISIPHPCTQSWEEMTPDGQGRHCAHCHKTVIDFTTWSDTALYNYFAKDTGSTCGRFLSTQLNRKLVIPHQPHSRLYRMTVALGLTLLFTQTPHLLGQSRPPIATQTPDNIKYLDDVPRIQTGGGYDISSTVSGMYQQKRGESIAVKAYGSLTGQITDQAKEGMISATVRMFQNGALKAGTVSDIDGHFVIDSLESGVYMARIDYVGYDPVEDNIVIKANSQTNQNFKLIRDKTRCISYGMIRIEYKVPLLNHDNPTKRIFTRDQIDHMPR